MKRVALLLSTLVLPGARAQSHAPLPVGQLQARDAHALLWLADGRLLFGHHDGVQVSTDRGSTWKKLLDKPNFDAMNIQVSGQTIILAGHDVYATSTDARRWVHRTLRGLRGTDLHGYAVEPGTAGRHYAWEAASGLHGSADGGLTWKPLVAQNLPEDVMKFAAGSNGLLYALSAKTGLWHSTNGGKSFSMLITPDRQPSTVTVGTDGSLWISGNRGVWRQRNKAWTRIAGGVALLIAVNPKRPNEAVWVDQYGIVHRIGR